ncbi:MAG TPA: (4Fe-4S)-binding protein [Acidimicrobiales bacterium]|nr:(4Fe-4S)-binding protein [Acidimicrobiales bacterium]
MKRYEGRGITITWEPERCQHAAECVRGLPGVFDSSKKPWIDPLGASADEIAMVIDRCPSRALGYERTGD